ncbi:Linear gramicidin dehydrogenase LgrE [Bordetella ansorpii]|uniref:Linear gramicidin dehydrogenase LgrE n=1 Tax=Bordetella ansorpii TaxID=288768 RepID=A0A157SVY9_9BORD|nr:alpha/beta fold hydrolase [Bordetella ansorpii]SAI74501.1 Linear gramicidin dehydrogenase LgrE [Bordetella ansorpii]
MAPTRLVCLPCAGASATMYLRWRRLLPAWLDVVPAELPGRGSRLAEDIATDFDALVEALCTELSASLQGDYVLFGHSMGALLAYGIAVRLRAEGRALPRALVASGSPAPSRRDPSRFAGLDSDDSLIEDMRKQGGTPDEVYAHADMLRMTLDILRADYQVCRSFRARPQAPLPLPIHVFAGRADDIGLDNLLPWREAADACTLDWFDGGHFFVRHEEGDVLRMLERRLQVRTTQVSAEARPVAA